MADNTTEQNPDLDGEFTVGMRIFGGAAWGTVTSLLIGSILVCLPQYPRSWLWVVPGIWLVLSVIGIAIQWSVARGPCPKCGTVQTVQPIGKRCSECRSYLKAVNRQVVRF